MFEELGIGRAIAIGPHIPMQCKLPKKPIASAVKISGDIMFKYKLDTRNSKAVNTDKFK